MKRRPLPWPIFILVTASLLFSVIVFFADKLDLDDPWLVLCVFLYNFVSFIVLCYKKAIPTNGIRKS